MSLITKANYVYYNVPHDETKKKNGVMKSLFGYLLSLFCIFLICHFVGGGVSGVQNVLFVDGAQFDLQTT